MKPDSFAPGRTTARLPGLLAVVLCLAIPGVAGAQVTAPPPPLPERAIEFPAFQDFTLENGLRVVILPYGPQPVASARLYVRGGSAHAPPELAGLASMAATVLSRGTESRTADEISTAIEGVGGSLSASASQDFFVISTSVLTDHLELAFELLEDVTRNATFPEDEVELARRQTLSNLQAQMGQPQAVAQRRFDAIVYGDHPYGVSSSPETVQAITRDDLIRFRDEIVHPAEALLMVAGGIDAEEVEALVRRHFADWAPGASLEADLPAVPERTEARIYLVHRPGSVQSVMGIGHAGITPDDPDYFPLQVMSRVLGGGADSRLFRILREEKGWTYGANSQITRPADRGVIRAITEVRTEVTDSALVELLHQMERIRQEPVPAGEMDAARNFLAGSFPLRLETAAQVAEQLATQLLLDLPLDDLTGYPDRIRAVSAAEVQQAARDHLHPDRAAIVVVGDGSRILDKLEGIAPMELFDVRGDPLTRDDILGEPAVVEWDGARLEEGVRRYDLQVQGQNLGNAEYRLERDGDTWVASSTMAAPGGGQQSRLRFSASDLAPLSLEQELDQGPVRIHAEIRVQDGRMQGRVELPEQLGGPQEYDQEMGPGLLLPGMEEFALAVADLEEGVRLTIPYMDLTRGEEVRLGARVTDREQIRVPAGEFDTWRVEIEGGDTPLVLFLRVEAPHILIRQEFQGQPVQLNLTSFGPL